MVWKQWVFEMAIMESLPLHLSREQLLSLIRLYPTPEKALQQLVPLFLDQPFSQPKAVLIRALQNYNGPLSASVQEFQRAVFERIKDLRDPVLDLCVAAAT